MKAKLIIVLIFKMVFCVETIAQTGIQLNTEEALNSYTLIRKYLGGDYIYLVNNCGEIVHYWIVDSEIDAKLLPNGNLLYVNSDEVRSYLIETDWDGGQVYKIAMPDGLFLHYDQIKRENGNVMSTAYEKISQEDLISIGLDVDTYSSVEWVDKIVEIDTETGIIVWEWSTFDHAVQERDQTKGNYGIVEENPGLLGFDAPFHSNRQAHFMINGIDYNLDLDQIAVSLRLMSEIVIIDHSTTTDEASGHIGGKLGKGGDIVYRWGNPKNYGRGSESDRFLYFQHNPNWIKYGEHKDKIICFNNGLRRSGADYSDIPIIDTKIQVDDSYFLAEGNAYEPPYPDKIINENNEYEFLSQYLSSAEVLENENIHVTSGLEGRIMEFNSGDEMVWDYWIPNRGAYRTYKYPAHHPAFDGRDLTPSGKLPGDESEYECELFAVSTYSPEKINFEVFIDEVDAFQVLVPQEEGFTASVLDISGKMLMTELSMSQKLQIHGESLSNGVYFVRVDLESGDWGIAKVVLMR